MLRGPGEGKRLVEYLFDVGFIGFSEREADILQVYGAGVELAHIVSLDGKAAMDADERAEFVFIQQVAEGRQHVIFFLRGNDRRVIP